LRASEIGANAIFKATKVDGVYDKDPHKNEDAVRYEHLTFVEALSKRLKVMDSTAFSLCMDTNMPIIVFNMNEPGSITRALLGEPMGTVVSN
jgi:uridylate kinase